MNNEYDRPMDVRFSAAEQFHANTLPAHGADGNGGWEKQIKAIHIFRTFKENKHMKRGWGRIDECSKNIGESIESAGKIAII